MGYAAQAAGVADYGKLCTIVRELGDFYELKATGYLTKQSDLVELIDAA